MARLLKQRYTKKGPGGRRITKQSRPWYIEYVNADGVRRRVPGFADKAATQQKAAELERKSEREQAGLVDRFAEHRKRPLAEHLIDYRRQLAATASSKTHVNTVVPRVRKILVSCRFTRWGDISASKVQQHLAGLKDTGLSVQTCKFYLQAIKQFCRWMVQDGRAPDSPVAHLKGGNVRTDRRHDRRALSDDELRRLLDAARKGPERFGMSGPVRARLYQLAVETGLRAGELRSLTWASFELGGDTPTVKVNAAYSKHRRDDTLPLKPSTAQMLARWRVESESGDQLHGVFSSMPEKTAKMFRADLAAARADWIEEAGADEEERKRRETSSFLAYRDEAGRFADFHALRHTFITNLARGGVHPKVAQQLARHSTITLTMDRYSHTVMGELADGLDALPDLEGARPARQRQRATGTCDVAPRSLPNGLPKNLPIPVARKKLHDAPVRTFDHSDTSMSHLKKPTKQGVLCTSAQRDASDCVKDLSPRRSGLEPLTFGSVDRCSIQLS